jgi:predicted RNase H-like HicB family nuclease
MRYWVRIFRHGKDYSAMVPDLPGCVAAGDSVEQIQALIGTAISMHVELMRKSGEKVPAATRRVDLELGELEDGELLTWVDVEFATAAPRKKQKVRG